MHDIFSCKPWVEPVAIAGSGVTNENIEKDRQSKPGTLNIMALYYIFLLIHYLVSLKIYFQSLLFIRIFKLIVFN